MKPLSILLILLAGASGTLPSVAAQQDSELILRDQAEILRKANRLKDLMTRLLQRYQQEGREQQAGLLQQGLAHLEASGILEETASVHNSLDTGKYADALRQQKEIVADLEVLLDILLDRQSVQNLQKEIEATENMLATASALLRRQQQLQRQTVDIGEGQATEAEQDIATQLADLIRRQRREARENQRQAGLRLPTLEAALHSLEQLLRQQQELEAKTEANLAGEQDLTLRREMFRLGELEQRQRDVNEQQRRTRDLRRLADGSRALRAAQDAGDPDRLDRQTARLEARLTASAANADQELAEKLHALADRIAALRATAQTAERHAALRKLAQDVADIAEQEGSRIDRARNKEQRSLIEAVGQAARDYREQSEQKSGATRFAGAKALETAIEDIQRSTGAEQEDDLERAMAASARALRRLAEARRAMRRANPEAGELAREMASKADQTSRDLRNSPAGESAEERAAQALDRAQESLRKLGESIQDDQSGGEPLQSESAHRHLQRSRQQLEQARDDLQAALGEAQSGRTQALARASDRQQQLAKESQAASEAIEAAQQGGQLNSQQSDRAQENLDKAQQAMQEAASSLERGHQSRASAQQEQAADSLEKAQESLQRNRSLSDEDRQQLRELASQQEELRREIIELAELAKERNNRQAEDALKEAAQAADRARQQLSDDDPAEAEEQQQQVSEKLEQAQEALEEERDRYMDLRQEELLFRIKDELQQFLEKQQPITLATGEAGKKLAAGRRLTRLVRRRLNQLGEQEQELADKLKFIKEALSEENVIVYSHVIETNEQDLRSISRRLSGSRPDPGEYTALLQHDVEERTTKLIEALKREQQRREQQQQQQQQPGENKFDNQRQRLVPIVAELKMLKELEQEMLIRTNITDRLLSSAANDDITDQELAMTEQLANQHNALTGIFTRVRAQLEEALSKQGEAEAEKGKENK